MINLLKKHFSPQSLLILLNLLLSEDKQYKVSANTLFKTFIIFHIEEIIKKRLIGLAEICVKKLISPLVNSLMLLTLTIPRWGPVVGKANSFMQTKSNTKSQIHRVPQATKVPVEQLSSTKSYLASCWNSSFKVVKRSRKSSLVLGDGVFTFHSPVFWASP